MRADMYKVIVERPRRGGGDRYYRPLPNDDDAPARESVRARHKQRKWLNENLRPLERYLASQVGRPWDKVYSEICAGIDRRNTVQQHIHQHLEDFVAVKVTIIDGELRANRRWRVLVPLSSSWSARYYVHPENGLLLVNRLRMETLKQQRKQRQDGYASRHGGIREGLLVIDSTNQLHRIEGVWYRIEVAPLSSSATLNEVRIDARQQEGREQLHAVRTP
jgi:hypothetical protein